MYKQPSVVGGNEIYYSIQNKEKWKVDGKENPGSTEKLRPNKNEIKQTNMYTRLYKYSRKSRLQHTKN